ncbi:zinc finger protein 510-like [Pleurodeles waltl]|uniref:zinc finger protein 510-like n=1 Tax=Pleurodeles waltl TaxID=8319 RepID=UPI00370951C9
MNRKVNHLEFVKCAKRNLQIGTKFEKAKLQFFQESKMGTNCRTLVSSGNNRELDGGETSQVENSFNKQIYSSTHQRKRKVEISENNTENETDHFVKLLPYQPDTEQKKARYSCTECMQTFSAKTSVTRHRRTHTGERPFQCTECEKKFIQNGDLIRHQRSHSGERPYTCAECDKSFGQRGHLRNHQRIHNKNKNLRMLNIRQGTATKDQQEYLCTEHENNVSEQIYVNDHQKYHTREKTHLSSECEKAFRWKDDVITHCITTSGDLTSQCRENNENFVQNMNLLLKQKMLGEERTGKTHTIMVKLIEVTIINDYFVQRIVDSEDQNGQKESSTRTLQNKILR